jgi:hypothetical protein
MISIGRLTVIGVSALMFRMLWKKSMEERSHVARGSSSNGSSGSQPSQPVDVDALAEEKPDLQGVASGTASL